MEQAYKKQTRVALISFLIVLALTHLFPLYFLFPGLTEFTVFGFPAHYFFTLVISWIGTMIFYFFYIQISEKIDREVEETSFAALEAEEKARGGTAGVTGGTR
jgi:putative solute:sodium symporter small subunit